MELEYCVYGHDGRNEARHPFAWWFCGWYMNFEAAIEDAAHMSSRYPSEVYTVICE